MLTFEIGALFTVASTLLVYRLHINLFELIYSFFLTVLGDYSRVGAGSIVLKPLPKGSLAVGIPAVVKSIDPQYMEKEEIEPGLTGLETDDLVDKPIVELNKR